MSWDACWCCGYFFTQMASDSRRQRVEIAPDITKRPQKLWSLKLCGISELVALFVQFFGVKHLFWSSFIVPFCNSCRKTIEKSLAIGEPFWNACMVKGKRILLISFKGLCIKKNRTRTICIYTTYKAKASKTIRGFGHSISLTAVLVHEYFRIWEFKKYSRFVFEVLRS